MDLEIKFPTRSPMVDLCVSAGERCLSERDLQRWDKTSVMMCRPMDFVWCHQKTYASSLLLCNDHVARLIEFV